MKKWHINKEPLIFEISETEKLNYCRVRTFIEILGGKWKFGIITLLFEKSRRYSEIIKLMQTASEKMILTSLRELEEHKIVERIYHNETPLRVEYKLTAYGATLKPVLNQIEEWGNTHIEKYPETIFFDTPKKVKVV